MRAVRLSRCAPPCATSHSDAPTVAGRHEEQAAGDREDHESEEGNLRSVGEWQVSTGLPWYHPTHRAGPQARASRSLRALRKPAAHEPCTHAARVRLSHTPRRCANRQQPRAKPPPYLFVQKLDEVDNDGKLIKWCVGHFTKEHTVACYHGAWYVVTQKGREWLTVPKANYKRSEADVYNAYAKNRTTAQPTEHSHTQLTTHTHTHTHPCSQGSIALRDPRVAGAQGAQGHEVQVLRREAVVAAPAAHPQLLYPRARVSAVPCDGTCNAPRANRRMKTAVRKVDVQTAV